MSGRQREAMRAALRRRWDINRRGGYRARASRWRVWPWIVLQRLGRHRWIDARVFWGDRIRLYTGELNSRGIMPFGYSELALTALMIELLQPGMKVVDIGTHLGYEAMLACALVGPGGKVVGFEPQADIADWARLNLRQYPQARLVQAAVGEAAGVAEFADLGIERSGFSGMCDASDAGGKTYRAELTTLPAALRSDERPVDFIKCDAEGAELSILRGALDLLAQDRPFLVLEADMPQEQPARPRVKQFIDLLAPLGYRGMSFDYDGGLRLAAFGALSEKHANVAFVHSSRAHLLAGLAPF